MSSKIDKINIIEMVKMIKNWMHSTQEIFANVLERSVTLGDPEIFSGDISEIFTPEEAKSHIAFPMNFKVKTNETLYFIVKKDSLARIIDILIGGDGSPLKTDITDTHLIVFLQAVKEMAAAFSSIMRQDYGRTINAEPEKPEIKQDLTRILDNSGLTAFKLQIDAENLFSSNIYLLLPNSTYELLQRENIPGGLKKMDNSIPAARRPGTRSVPIFRKAEFDPLAPEEKEEDIPNIDLVLDIPLKLSVVLGNTGISLRDLIEIKPGAIFSLEKSAGEPVELFVNQKFVGYGEVIVIDEKFGVKVIEVPDAVDGSDFIGGK